MVDRRLRKIQDIITTHTTSVINAMEIKMKEIFKN